MTWQKISAAIAGVAATAGALGAVFWGVPHYIDRTVATAVQAEVAAVAADLDAVDTSADASAAQIQAISTQLTSIENRMIERDRLFMEWLERQAAGN